MNRTQISLSLLIMIVTVYSVRLLPLLFLRKKITNRFLLSFFHYVPYVTLAVMTFPAILETAGSPLCGLVSLIIGILGAWFIGDMFVVAVLCSLSFYICSLFI